MSVENNVPEIRFKGFSDQWQSLSLDKITDVYDGTHQTPTYIKNGVMFLSAENIRTLTSQKFISEKDFKEEFKVYPQKNDVLMTRIGDVGTANVVETDDDKAYYVTLALLKYKQLSPYFLKSAIASPYVQRDIWLRTLHIAFPKKINMNEIKQVAVSCPTDKRESDHLGNTFQKLDNLINQHQQKHDKLSNIKKAMLEKMFPKQGETMPEIRFKGFSGEWEEIGLLDSIERIIDFRGRTPKKLGLDWSPTGYRALSALNVKQGYIDFSIDPHFGDQKLYDKWMNGSDLHQGQVLFTTEAPMGNVAQVPNADKYILSQRTIAFVVKPEVITEDFLAVLLRSLNVFRELSALSSGGTAKGVSQKVLSNLNVLIPTELDEQTAIGNYFQKLDELINQHQQQITKLNNIKQACLSKMFV
ncbi:restriction endonuclease subunit S [Shewanella sp. Isolate7]|uniref:restriction endonuclease subunit S n=1 Tax=Shewanella sp. Isolate7 TaxID=2908528 RepID=UPI001EFE9578|nr:restriction endonuclease subunit S [Shewanella sp. Isolate7]MCG9723484.1 restriction endonuclease subunit S [Shewanella sp. Isolate7]